MFAKSLVFLSKRRDYNKMFNNQIIYSKDV